MPTLLQIGMEVVYRDLAVMNCENILEHLYMCNTFSRPEV
jgi:hypothetical protein